jgi:hypothetical protein
MALGETAKRIRITMEPVTVTTNPKGSYETMLDDLVRRFTDAWWQAGSAFPHLERTYLLREKLRREKVLRSAVDMLIAETSRPALAANGLDGQRDRLERQIVAFAREIFDFDETALQAFLTTGFRDAVLEFIRQVIDFDPGLTQPEINQAAHNVWSMNLFQYLFGLRVELTPAIFAYSLLYPYTDNYLDDPALPAAVKKSVIERLTGRLMGSDVAPANRNEERIFELVSLIESQFDRSRYPQVFESLIAIQSAQIESLKLIDPRASPYEVDVLRICMKKGGAATLADGFLVAGDLTPAQQDLAFGYGAFTQLLDDQEDVHSDRQAGLMTVFSQAAAGWQLDGLVNRLFAFKDFALGNMPALEPPTAAPISATVLRGIDLLLIQGAGAAHRYHSRPYLRAIEDAFPVRFSELALQRRRLTRHKTVLGGLFEIFGI